MVKGMFKRLSLIIVTFLVLAGPGMALVQTASAQNSGLLSFTPVLQLEVDTSALNEEIQPDGKAINVPVTVKYRIDVPEWLQNPLLIPIERFIVYGKLGIIPPMKIHLSVVNKPEWVDVSITSPDIYIDIKENEYSCAQTSISISVYKDAPAEVYTLILRAESDSMGRVASQSVEAQFKIKPGYIPLITINTEKPIKEAGPMTTLTFPIKICNNANKETVVKLVDYDMPPGWGVQPSQNQIVIPKDGEATLSVAVTTPPGFGWTPNQVQQIKFKFVALPSPPPLEYEETSSNTYVYSISVKSGSAPAAGLIGGALAVIIAVVAIILLVFKRKKG
ncbi:MAG: hypothetical protein DRN19_01500 [Thermoplasmata archaeon]|nr:MAG: hypothetical protein DRN19_01500 [Thermoplasmata archaeon]